VQADDLFVGLGQLGAEREGQADAHGAERARVQAMAGSMRLHGLAAKD
jgi:hypothetical protein